MTAAQSSPRLLAVSDLHAGYAANRMVIERLRPVTPADWLIVAGDVGELAGGIVDTLAELRSRFTRVIWVPGNHELWTHPSDPVTLRGEERYRHLVEGCRAADVLTPEDEYPVWHGAGGPVVIAPLFLLYDYSFLPPGVTTQAAALELAYETGVVCTDEQFLHPDPYPTRAAWCHARLDYSRARLDQLDPELPTVLVNHWPMTRLPTRILRYPQFAQWCGTEHTGDWHVKYRSSAVVYGHLHIPRTTFEDGVRFEEVSLGYPREWRPRERRMPWPRQILPVPA
ncbi:MAG TPA: metallophosphoesterase [Jatrophihabitans sp.]|nr:metallophosphoesterase [Jatrophihabitans sp.]